MVSLPKKPFLAKVDLFLVFKSLTTMVDPVKTMNTMEIRIAGVEEGNVYSSFSVEKAQVDDYQQRLRR